MNIDIDKINTYEKRNKVNTIIRRRTYEVIEEAHFTASEILSDDFMQQ